MGLTSYLAQAGPWKRILGFFIRDDFDLALRSDEDLVLYDVYDFFNNKNSCHRSLTYVGSSQNKKKRWNDHRNWWIDDQAILTKTSQNVKYDDFFSEYKKMCQLDAARTKKSQRHGG